MLCGHPVQKESRACEDIATLFDVVEFSREAPFAYTNVSSS